MTIKPIGNRVLLKSVEIEEKTKGGIILPGTATQEKPNTGEIVAVGTGKELEGLKVGDKVVFEGVISLQKDFGAGYKYDIIMEDAKKK